MKLVGVEGIDRSGKTTLVAALTTALSGSGLRVAAWKEPADDPLGRVFRQLSTGDGHNPTALALLSSAARHEQQPALAGLGADVVISDRYYLSGLAYHAADGVDPVFYQQLNMGIRRPDRYLFLDIEPQAAAARHPCGQLDRWEGETITALLPAAYDKALRLVEESEDAAVAHLDATLAPARVLAHALRALDPLLTPMTGGRR